MTVRLKEDSTEDQPHVTFCRADHKSYSRSKQLILLSLMRFDDSLNHASPSGRFRQARLCFTVPRSHVFRNQSTHDLIYLPGAGP